VVESDSSSSPKKMLNDILFRRRFGLSSPMGSLDNPGFGIIPTARFRRYCMTWASEAGNAWVLSCVRVASGVYWLADTPGIAT
jgi:hypothetical protein